MRESQARAEPSNAGEREAAVLGGKPGMLPLDILTQVFALDREYLSERRKSDCHEWEIKYL